MNLRIWRGARACGIGLLAAGAVLTASTAQALPPNPAHHWTFDDTGSTAADTGTIGGAPGTIGPSVTHIPDGAIGAALHFVDDFSGQSFVDFGNGVGQFGTADFTISLWLRTTALENQELVGNRLDPSGGNFFSIRTSNGSAIFELDQDASGTNYEPVGSNVNDVNVADGSWHFVVARRQGTEVDLFVDGRKYRSPAVNTSPTNINNGNDLIAGFSPGVQPCCNTALNGDLDDIRIYDTALSDSDIVPPADTDGDGVPDSADLCPGTPAGSVVDANGCSIAQLCPCAGPMNGGAWKNHGAYVSCTSHAADTFVNLGLITPMDVGGIVSTAATSTCGYPRR